MTMTHSHHASPTVVPAAEADNAAERDDAPVATGRFVGAAVTPREIQFRIQQQSEQLRRVESRVQDRQAQLDALERRLLTLLESIQRETRHAHEARKQAEEARRSLERTRPERITEALAEAHQQVQSLEQRIAAAHGASDRMQGAAEATLHGLEERLGAFDQRAGAVLSEHFAEAKRRLAAESDEAIERLRADLDQAMQAVRKQAASHLHATATRSQALARQGRESAEKTALEISGRLENETGRTLERVTDRAREAERRVEAVAAEREAAWRGQVDDQARAMLEAVEEASERAKAQLSTRVQEVQQMLAGRVEVAEARLAEHESRLDAEFTRRQRSMSESMAEQAEHLAAERQRLESEAKRLHEEMAQHLAMSRETSDRLAAELNELRERASAQLVEASASVGQVGEMIDGRTERLRAMLDQRFAEVGRQLEAPLAEALASCGRSMRAELDGLERRLDRLRRTLPVHTGSMLRAMDEQVAAAVAEVETRTRTVAERAASRLVAGAIERAPDDGGEPTDADAEMESDSDAELLSAGVERSAAEVRARLGSACAGRLSATPRLDAMAAAAERGARVVARAATVTPTSR